GMLAAEAGFEQLMAAEEGSVTPVDMSAYEKNLKKSWVWDELQEVRNLRPSFNTRLGIWGGLAYSGIDSLILKGRVPWTFRHKGTDSGHTGKARQVSHHPQNYAPLSTDILTSVSLTSTNHAEDQPVHLQLPYTTLYPDSASATGETTEVDGDAVDAQRAKEAAQARVHHIKVNVGEYAGLLGRACPASVYEYVDAEPGEEGSWEGKKLVINSQLIYNQAPPTLTSLQENTAFFRSPSPFHRKPFQVVDIPGHPRIRGQFTNYFQDGSKGKSTANGVKAVVFVCDAAALTRNAGAVAEHLHLVMHSISNLPPSQPQPPLLVFANKADLLPTPAATGAAGGVKLKIPNKALAISRTTTVLERELEKRRLNSFKSGPAVLSDIGDEHGEDEDTVGGLDVTEGETFRFEKWDGGVIEVRSGWVDVQRATASAAGHESTDEGSENEEHEKREKVRDPKVAEPKTDGLADLVNWIAALR
ncbi:9717_t:CDS:2, partial [Acaulospora colombiana]